MLAHAPGQNPTRPRKSSDYSDRLLEELLSPGAGAIADQPHLTPRELAVLRSASLGRRISDTARALGLSAETVRTHVKNANQKLGTRTITHAVAEAMRWRSFP
jgi:DNA-binding CsgD family transcriptional regulator